MSKIAIDVVLLPPKEIIDVCFDINKRAFGSGKGRFRMSENDFIPHISLAIGCVEEKILEKVIEEVKLVVLKQNSLKLIIEKIGMFIREDGDRGFLKVKVSEELRELHEKVLREVSDCFVGCDSANVLIEGEVTGMGKSTRNIINNYSEFYSGKKYNAHISLGCFDSDVFVEGVNFPISFVAEEMAIFRVGDGCTCRELVWKGKLL